MIPALVIVGTLLLVWFVLVVVISGDGTVPTCPHCGHAYFIEGPPHNKTACEVAKLRREVAEWRAECTGQTTENDQ